MKLDIGKIAIGALGVYLLLPGPEDLATAGTTLLPSAVLGAALIAHAVGIKLPRIFG